MVVETGFAAAGLASCRFVGGDVVEVTLSPESAPPINCSPWYAFRARTLDESERNLQIRFTYSECEHRYPPKASYDMIDWSGLGSVGSQSDAATFELTVTSRPVYVAAQEILPVATYSSWIDQLSDSGKARTEVIGQSVEGRPIEALTIGNPQARDVVLVLGRQHPPEISGARGLFAYVDTLVSDDAVMQAYREDVLTIVVPVLNPDGVENGHWRHNAGGVDLNRDWAAYTQPETRAVRDKLQSLLDEDYRLVLVLDFHSTRRDVLYTLAEDIETDPPGLVEDWIVALNRRTPAFSFDLAPGYSAGSGVAKNFFYERFGVPAVTIEFGDETDREAIAREGQAIAYAWAEVFAERR